MQDDESGNSASTGGQILYLLVLMLRLKAWKFLFWLLLVPAMFLNFYTMKGMERDNPDTKSGPSVKTISAASFGAWKSLVSSSASVETRAMEEITRTRGGASGSWLTKCQSSRECQASFMGSILSLSDATRAYMKFERLSVQFECLDGIRADLICPYLFHVMSQSMDTSGATGAAVFKDVQFLKLFDKFESDSTRKAKLRANISAPDSLCTRTALSDGIFFLQFPLYFMPHMVVVAAAMTLYFTVSSLACVTSLKENGFLQLMFNSGLSVAAFWVVVWFITLVEVLVMSSLVLLSYTSQCPGFYSSAGLVRAFVILTCFFIFIASLGLLFATLVASYFIILLLMIFVNVLLALIALLCRLNLAAASGQMANRSGEVMLMLIFPPGHIVEYLLETILPQSPAFNRPKGYKEYYNLIEVLIPTIPPVLIFLTIYLDFIVKNGNGLCLPFAYPFNPNFWSPYGQKLIEMLDKQTKRANVEPTTGVPAVIASDIFMTYPAGPCRTGPTVLKGVTCTVYQGQITALIGHNGAGKTTLIRVLMGEEIPTSGLAVINGHRVTDPYQRLALRGAVSICKQVDVLSSYLTVMESMKLTLLAKGFTVESQVNKVLDMMKHLGLEGKENVKAMELSGGQMRKVCSILCLLGNPKLVILDEPTSGLDPVSRRNLWQILQDHKAGRSIILCTQFMDEADILADRKMFLSGGKLICAGSSLFLKHAFGCCVSINVSLKSESYTKQLMKLLKKVKLVSQFQTELLLQVSSEKPQILADAIQALEEHPELVDAFGVSQAQLDDIFMRLKDIDMDNIEASFKSKKLRKLGRGGSGKVMVEKVDFSSLYNFESSKSIHSSLMTQFSALMSMNLSRQWKAKMKFCFRIIFPLLLVAAIATLGSNENAKIQAEKKPKPKASSVDVNSDVNKGDKSIVLTNLNDSSFASGAAPLGICIVDSEKDLNDLECQYIFETYRSQIIVKDNSKSIKDFVQEAKTRDALRKLCRKSSKYMVYNCFYAYASSWDTATSNKDRTVYLGFYEIPSDSPEPDMLAKALHLEFRYYEKFAKYFGATNQANARNFTLDSAYLAETLKGLTFISCQELFSLLSAFALIPVTYLNDPIEDKDCGVRQHLASMGMSTMAYWMNTFLLHWMHYAICFFVASLACLVLERYQNSYFLVNLVLPTMFMGTISSQLSVYVVSAMMKRTNAVVLVLYFFFAMFVGMGAGYIQSFYTPLIILTCILPQITPVVYLLFGMKVLMYSMLFFDVNTAGEIANLNSIFGSCDILMICLIAMPIHILILIGLIAFIENPGSLLIVCRRSVAPTKETIKPAKDEGVSIEADRINKSVKNSANMLEVRDLMKVYPNGVRAVRGTTFGAYAGEIIGLLGPNGAGKTTSMSIIVGEEEASSGSSEVHFTGTWMSGVDGAKCGAIGYCPQHNPVFNSISVFEHLRFYAQIRGIPSQLATAQIAGLIEGLGLKPHQAKAAEQLSGGNKRRLCLAIALLGNPSLVVIDEASTGVDPENKRFIWSAIRGMASKHRSVMITTHSMEEVEALCSRVGIMNKGVMIGFGTVQQLRSRHGEAYTLDVLMKAKQPRKLDLKKKKLAKRIAKQFKNATVMEDLMRCMQFYLPKKNIDTFSGALRWLISKKKSLGIQYFSLYQMSLDQVFVKLVNEYDKS